MLPIKAQSIITPPRLIGSLLAGFDSITRHLYLILFPVALDFILWFGPHLRIRQLMQSIYDQMVSLSAMSDPASVDVIQANGEIWKYIGEHLNLVAAMRTYPVGIPTLMTAYLPLKTPGATNPLIVDVSSVFSILGIWVLGSLVGYIVGSLYFSAVSNASITDKIELRAIIKAWPWNSLQVILLSLGLAILLMAIAIPASCMVSVLSVINPTMGRILLFIFLGFLVWVIFPFLFSAHGIFVNRMNAWASVRRGVFLTRLTVPTTGLLFLSILFISQLLNYVWTMPQEDSWMMLIGIAGHAFVSTGLLATSFVYYKQADQWAQSIQKQVSTLPPSQTGA